MLKLLDSVVHVVEQSVSVALISLAFQLLAQPNVANGVAFDIAGTPMDRFHLYLVKAEKWRLLHVSFDAYHQVLQPVAFDVVVHVLDLVVFYFPNVLHVEHLMLHVHLSIDLIYLANFHNMLIG